MQGVTVVNRRGRDVEKGLVVVGDLVAGDEGRIGLGVAEKGGVGGEGDYEGGIGVVDRYQGNFEVAGCALSGRVRVRGTWDGSEVGG